MVIWTTQSLEVASQLMALQNYSRPRQAEHEFAHANDWLQQSCQFDNWPIWCWPDHPTDAELSTRLAAQCGNSSESNHLAVISLHVPNNTKIIFSNFHAWHHVLFYLYLDSSENIMDFEQRCKSQGVDPHALQSCGDIPLKQEVCRSWQKMFDLQWCKEHLASSHMQMCIDHIDPHWVVSIKKVTLLETGRLGMEHLFLKGSDAIDHEEK